LTRHCQDDPYKLAPVKTDIQKMAEENKIKTDQLTNALFLFQQQMRAQFEQLLLQITSINQPSSQPPPSAYGGGTN